MPTVIGSGVVETRSGGGSPVTEVQICRSCDADLDVRDRFCPACGTPNLGARRSARFAPSVEVEDPIEALPETIRPDELRCPRCSRAVKRQADYCWWCGLEMADVARRADRSETFGVWTQPGPHGTVGYRPVTARASAVRVLLWALGLLSLVCLGFLSARLAANESGEALGIARSDLARWGDAALVALGVGGAVVGVLLVAFVHRASSNLAGLMVVDARYPPHVSIWCWFLPLVNLVLPYSVVEDLWRVSGPDGPPLSESRNDKPSLVVYLWWPLVIAGFASLVASWLSMPASPATNLTTWRVVFLLASFGAFTLAVGLFALSVVVGEIADRQILRAERIGPPEWLRRRGLDGSSEEDPVTAPDAPPPLRDVDADRNWGRF